MIIKIKTEESGERIDALLSRKIENLSRSEAARLCDRGLVRLGGRPIKKSFKSEKGDTYEIKIEEPVADILPENIALQIEYEDEFIAIVNKPRGMLVYPAGGVSSGTLLNALLYRYGKNLSKQAGIERAGIVHRLDKDSSGLLLIAKSEEAHAKLTQLLLRREVSRIYEGITKGCPVDTEGEIEEPINRHPGLRIKMATGFGGREAKTSFKLIKPYKGYAHMRFILHTGRTHQIRVHARSMGCPLLGDGVYGKGRELGIIGHCLHAKELGFEHPISGKRIEIVSELPEYFKEILEKLEKLYSID